MKAQDRSPAPSGLVATLGRLDLTTLVVNTVVGGGIFGLPMVVAGLLGASSLLGYVAAAAGIGVIVLCFAEVSAQFRSAGGPYLYAREAFGPFVGLQVGWITWVMRISATAANANLFVLYLQTIWAPAKTPEVRWAVITALFAAPAFINIRGVKQGATASNLFVAAKLLPLLVFVAAGLFFIRPQNLASWPSAGHGHWFRAILLLVFAYGGFDNATLPTSEMRNPSRDAPFALLAGMGIVTALYLLIQFVFQGTLPAGTATDRPLATAAEHFLGAPGGWLMAAGAMASVWGWFAATMLGTPRLTFALGERGDFPRFFSAVHPRFRTPYVSILFYAGLGWVLALSGSFEWDASLSAVARLFTYGVTCGALPVFRRRDPGAATFRVPAGRLMAALGVAFCLVLLTQMGRLEFVILAGTISLAALTWLSTRRRAVS
ncbi:MAG TPA: amino acid permease [Candidatus Acidoferrales bacterium]|nr:amino acid permease [Candidatus Acidoferrales bacterium]